jgi:hypothetical protein
MAMTRKNRKGKSSKKATPGYGAIPLGGALPATPAPANTGINGFGGSRSAKKTSAVTSGGGSFGQK